MYENQVVLFSQVYMTNFFGLSQKITTFNSLNFPRKPMNNEPQPSVQKQNLGFGDSLEERFSDEKLRWGLKLDQVGEKLGRRRRIEWQ